MNEDMVCPKDGTPIFRGPDAHGACFCPKCRGWWEDPPSGRELRQILESPGNPVVSIQAFSAEVNLRSEAEARIKELEARVAELEAAADGGTDGVDKTL